MKSDHLFYELFRKYAHSFFELMKEKMPCQYLGWSISLKETEKRMDFLFVPEEAEHPLYVVEIQGYPDSLIYMRVIKETLMLVEDLELWKTQNWEVIVIFLEKKFDPGWEKWQKLLHQASSFPLRVIYLDKLSSEFWQKAPIPLRNIQILFQESEEDLKKILPELIKEIEEQHQGKKDLEQQIDFLYRIVTTKFSYLTIEEIEKMIHLTPLEQTVSGQQLIQIGNEKGMEKGTLKTLSKLLKLKFREAAENWISELPNYSPTSLEKIEERILFEDNLEKIFQGLEKKITSKRKQ